MSHQAALVKRIRYKKNLSQKDLADKLGYESAQFISNIERDIAGIPLQVAKTMIKKKLASKEEFYSAMIQDFSELLRSAL